MNGVRALFTAKDIPGTNSFIPFKAGLPGISEAEEVFVGVDSEIAYYGQPCAMIVAKSMSLANAAALKVEIVYQTVEADDRKVIATLDDWRKCGKIENSSTKTFIIHDENVSDATSMPIGAVKNISGEVQFGPQYHFHMEAQSTYCLPMDDGGIEVRSATQWMDLTQIAIAEMLNLPNNKVNLIVKRMGGAYGAKITRASHVACACALACVKLRKPVRFVLTIESNMNVCGKRYPCLSAYNVGYDSANGKIEKFETTLSLDYGCSMNDDVSIFIDETFKTGVYGPANNWKIHFKTVKTDAPSATWCRSPGTTEGIGTIEYIIENIAHAVKQDPAKVRLNNIPTGSRMHTIYSDFLKDVGE